MSRVFSLNFCNVYHGDNFSLLLSSCDFSWFLAAFIKELCLSSRLSVWFLLPRLSYFIAVFVKVWFFPQTLLSRSLWVWCFCHVHQGEKNSLSFPSCAFSFFFSHIYQGISSFATFFFFFCFSRICQVITRINEVWFFYLHFSEVCLSPHLSLWFILPVLSYCSVLGVLFRFCHRIN